MLTPSGQIHASRPMCPLLKVGLYRGTGAEYVHVQNHHDTKKYNKSDAMLLTTKLKQCIHVSRLTVYKRTAIIDVSEYTHTRQRIYHTKRGKYVEVCIYRDRFSSD